MGKQTGCSRKFPSKRSNASSTLAQKACRRLPVTKGEDLLAAPGNGHGTRFPPHLRRPLPARHWDGPAPGRDVRAFPGKGAGSFPQASTPAPAGRGGTPPRGVQGMCGPGASPTLRWMRWSPSTFWTTCSGRRTRTGPTRSSPMGVDNSTTDEGMECFGVFGPMRKFAPSFPGFLLRNW